jgi:hypothetical protein
MTRVSCPCSCGHESSQLPWITTRRPVEARGTVARSVVISPLFRVLKDQVVTFSLELLSKLMNTSTCRAIRALMNARPSWIRRKAHESGNSRRVLSKNYIFVRPAVYCWYNALLQQQEGGYIMRDRKYKGAVDASRGGAARESTICSILMLIPFSLRNARTPRTRW